ncbi:MAG: hypothetical protein ABSD67_08085 [Terracidiphilus sp.]|jgi:hypothetical protein
MAEVINKCREPLNRPLTQQERNLVRWLIDHSHRDAGSLLPQVERLSVVAKCNCGCPTIDFALDGQPVAKKGGRLVSDWLAEVEGMPVYVQLWQSNDRISTLEVGSLPGTDHPFGLPAIESILGY